MAFPSVFGPPMCAPLSVYYIHSPVRHFLEPRWAGIPVQSRLPIVYYSFTLLIVSILYSAPIRLLTRFKFTTIYAQIPRPGLVGTGAVDSRGRTIEAEYATSTPVPAAAPGWLHPTIGNRTEAEALLRRQPSATGALHYLVRPRAGAERSFAISVIAKGKLSHHKLEQPKEGGSWGGQRQAGQVGEDGGGRHQGHRRAAWTKGGVRACGAGDGEVGRYGLLERLAPLYSSNRTNIPLTVHVAGRRRAQPPFASL